MYKRQLSTLSWFDLPGRPSLPRPDLEALAARLNDAEGCAPEDEAAWRAQPVSGASPELWFGATGLGAYPEHCAPLQPSTLAPSQVREEILGALRGGAVRSG